jgi:UDP-N-acetylmuramyl pentapeptide synthase
MNQNTVVLVKGSRFMKMEQVVNEIVQHMTAENKGAAH